MPKNLHTEKLFPYIFFAPEKIQKKFYNFHGNETSNRFYNKYGDSSFLGLLFIDNRVLCYNIEIYSTKEDKAKYLDITTVFNKLLKEVNIFHLSFLINIALQKFYRENVLTENILPYIRYQNNGTYKHKFRYAVIKHRGRHRLFVENNKDENQRVWNRILLSAIRKESLYKSFREYKTEGFNLFNNLYQSLPEVNSYNNVRNSSNGLQKQVKKRRELYKRNLQRRRILCRSNRFPE